MKTLELVNGEYKQKRIYRIYGAMLTRCNNPNSEKYKNYGARGITVCEEWKNFKSFEQWAYENGYDSSLSIDRIDVNGNYEPNNCRWIPLSEQALNRTTNHYLEIDGERKTILEWSKLSGIKWNTIKARIDMGWAPIDAIFLPTSKVPYRLRKDKKCIATTTASNSASKTGS